MKKALLTFLIVATVSAACWGFPLTRATGARPLSLGNAFVGQASDASALFLNAAGLATINHWQLTSMYSQPDEDTLFTSIGYAKPNLWGGTLGLGYRNRTINNVQVSAETISVTDQELLFAYSRSVGEQISAGLALRLTSAGPSRAVTGYSGSSGNGFDFSLKYNYLPWWQLGFAWQNIGGVVINQGGTKDFIDSIVRVGNSFYLTERDLRLNVDLEKQGEDPFAYHLGAEWWPIEMLALRLGIDQVAKNQTENYNNTTAGLGLKTNGFTFDYAWYRSSDITQDTTNYFSVGYLGPEPPRSKKPEPKTIKAFPSPEPKPAIATELRRVRFSDIPEGHWAKEPAEKLATAGLLSGYPDGTYKPNVKMNRRHFTQVWQAAKNVVNGEIWTTDPQKLVTRQEAARQMGLPGDLSRPNDPITRAEFAVLLSQTQIGQAALKRLPPLID